MSDTPTASVLQKLSRLLRNEPMGSPALVVPLAVMLYLRWLDFQDAESAAMAAFDESDYRSLLPPSLQWRQWHEMPPAELQHFFAEKLPKAIERLGSAHDPISASLQRMRSAFHAVALLPEQTLAILTDWLAAQPFETPNDRLKMLEVFDAVLDKNSGRHLGQFRTPVSINELLAAIAIPAAGEHLYDPCFGFGGNLTAACRRVRQSDPREFSRSSSSALDISGAEINADAYVVALARLALAGVATPKLELGNSLEREAHSNPRKQGFDVILCNPPWGSKMNPRGMDHFPVQTTDSTSLFVQHALSQLRPEGRAAIVVPQGFLFQQGRVSAVRKWLLEQHRVEALVSLPEGAFMPYTGIKAAILVLRRGKGPTSRVRMVEGADFFEPKKPQEPIAILPQKREELANTVRTALPGKYSWDVDVSTLVDLGFDLTIERRDKSTLETILAGLGKGIPVVPLKEACRIGSGIAIKSAELVDFTPSENAVPYIRIGDILLGQTGKARSWLMSEATNRVGLRYRLRAGDVLVSRSGTIGKVGVVRNGAVGGVASNGFFVLSPEESRLDPHFLSAFLTSSECAAWLKSRASGSVIQGLTKRFVETLPVPLPPLPVQHRVAADVREHGVDALTQLSLLLSQDENDPVAPWIDQAMRILRDAPLDADASYAVRFRIFGEVFKATRNRTLHTEAKSPLLFWVYRLDQVAESFRDSEEVPRGPALLSILQQGVAGMADAESQIKGHSPLESRAVELTRECISLLKKAIEGLLVDVRVVIGSKTESLRAGVQTELSLLVRNDGALPLRNVVLSAGSWKIQTKPVFVAERSEQILTVEIETPSTPGRHLLNVEWTAASLDGRNQKGRQEIAIELLSGAENSANLELGLSPYFISQPVGPDRNDVFFGREAVIDQIKRQLQSGNTVLLEGNRRAGKSSILKHLEGVNRIPGRFAVYSSFQAAAGAEKVAGMPTETVWRTLAQSLAAGLLSLQIDVPLPDGTVLKAGTAIGIAKACRAGISSDAPWEDFQDYLKQVLGLLEGLNMGLVLMIDEFDKLQEGIDSGVTSPQIPENIRYLIQTQPRFAVVMTGSRRMQRLRHEYWSALFGLGNRVSVTALDDQAARRLVTEPVKDRLLFTEEALALVTRLTARQPFLIQYLCNRIFEFASHAGQRSVTVSLVNEAAKAFVEDNEHFASLWDYAESDRRRLIIELCHRGSDGPDPLTFGVLHQQLATEHIEVTDADLDADLKFLQELELIDFTGADGGAVYRLTIPLMGQWLDAQQDYQALLAKAKAEQEDQI
jgi:type I restriction enzyme M protein